MWFVANKSTRHILYLGCASVCLCVCVCVCVRCKVSRRRNRWDKGVQSVGNYDAHASGLTDAHYSTGYNCTVLCTVTHAGVDPHVHTEEKCEVPRLSDLAAETLHSVGHIMDVQQQELPFLFFDILSLDSVVLHRCTV